MVNFFRADLIRHWGLSFSRLKSRFFPVRDVLTAVLLIGTLFFGGQAHAGNAIQWVTVDGGTSTTVASGATITVVVDNTGTSSWDSTNWYIGTSAPGTWNCDSGPSPSLTGTDQTYPFTITAPSTAGTYNAYFRTSGSTTCGSTNRSSTYTLSSSVIVLPPPVTVTPATGGGAIASNTAPTCSAAGTWTTLTGPAIAETTAGDIGLGKIVLSAPTGFEFNNLAPVTIRLTGNSTNTRNINDIVTGTSVPVTSITAGAITFTVTAISLRTNTLTWQGIQVRPTDSTASATGNITETGTSTISGINSSTNLGTLTEVTSVPACNSTTIANGATPSSVTIAPGAAITDLDYFTLATSNGTDTVTAVTVPLLPAVAFNNIAQVDLTDNSNVARCTAVTNPASNTISFTTCTISVNTTATQYKVRITPKSHLAMPLPAVGLSYATTGTVTSFTSTNAQSGSDSSSATVTIDNLSPNGATATSEIPGDMQVTLNWTTSSSVDFSRSVVLRWTGASAGTDVPAEGIDYVNGNTIGTATVACVRTTDAASSAVSGVDGAGTGGCSTSILTDGQAYTYKVFQKDSSGNYDVGVAMGTATPAATPALSEYHMDEAGWNGTLNEVLDSGTGGFNGTAAGLTTRPTTSNASPAIANSPGTCRYGVFNRSNKDYVALPATYPKLMAATGSFTITAWINVADNTLPNQRILIDDQNNTSPGGWGFSVGETGPPIGGLRFYYRQPGTVLLLDTPAIPSNQWLFVAVAVSLAAGTNASSASSYVYNTLGSLMTSAGPTTFTWTAGSDTGSPSIGGETNAATENTNLFGFGGNIDEVQVYQKALNQNALVAIAAQTHPCPITAPNHIRILHNGTGLTCMPETITVKACGDPACNTLYSGLVTTNLNGVIGAVTFSGGTTTASVAQTTAGSVTLGASSTSPTPATAARCFNGATETCTLTFSDAGLILANVANGTEATVPAQVAGVTSAQYVLRAVKKSTTTSACTAGLTGVQTVNFGYECNDPTSCAAGNLLKVNGTAVQSNSNNPLLGYSYTGINLTFDGNGNSTTPVSFNYEDVGQVTLRMQKAVNGASLLGNSNAFVVKPHHFAVDVCIATTSGDCPVNTAATPTDGSGSILAVAGTASTQTGVAFKATVRSVSATSTVTPSFGTAGSVSGSNATETVALTHTCVAPIIATACAGGTAASSLAGTKSFARSAFSSGIMTVSDLTWDDVGVITLSATNGSFMGSGPVSGTSSAAGRFRADHFNVSINSNGAMAGACLAGGFTYTGQPMGYGTTPSLTIKPMNAASGGSVTQNYQSAFQRLVASGVAITSPTADTTRLGKDGLTKTALAATMTTGAIINNSGTMTYTLNTGDQFTYTRDANALIGPYTTAVPLVVTAVTEPANDSVGAAGTLPTLMPAGVPVRDGRLQLRNSYGSELLALPVPLIAQYWNGSGWIQNTIDSCTPVVAPTSVSGLTFHPLPAATSQLSTKTTASVSATAKLAAGDGQLKFSAPGQGNGGYVDISISLASQPWLRYPWIAGAGDVDPTARATFGIYKSPLIYRRENY